MHAASNFDSTVKWYGGNGCMVCRSNFSNEGAKVGIQCIDLEVDADIDGQMGLCFDCATQVGRLVQLIPVATALEMVDAVEGKFLTAESFAADARIAASEAAVDREVVERLLAAQAAKAKPAPRAKVSA